MHGDLQGAEQEGGCRDKNQESGEFNKKPEEAVTGSSHEFTDVLFRGTSHVPFLILVIPGNGAYPPIRGKALYGGAVPFQ
jgi:hypothetical protein